MLHHLKVHLEHLGQATERHLRARARHT
jgi:hypothetical protein